MEDEIRHAKTGTVIWKRNSDDKCIVANCGCVMKQSYETGLRPLAKRVNDLSERSLLCNYVVLEHLDKSFMGL